MLRAVDYHEGFGVPAIVGEVEKSTEKKVILFL